MRRLYRILIGYFSLSGIAVHILAIGVFAAYPQIVDKAYSKYVQKKYDVLHSLNSRDYVVGDDIKKLLPAWKPKGPKDVGKGSIMFEGKQYSSFKEALSVLKDGGTLSIGEGIYREPLVIRANGVTIVGHGHVVLEKTAAEGKAAIITKGNDIHIENIECRHIAVPHRNGACIRHEGKNLSLTHVYFHSSQTGILTVGSPGIVQIDDSRFERLGFNNGQAHGIYIGGGDLIVRNSIFIAAKDQGQELKSRAVSTVIDRCLIASLSSDDSRALDIPNGGLLKVTNSVLHQGPKSVNGTLVGYGLEGLRYSHNAAEFNNNIIIMEREAGPNRLLHKHDDAPSPVFRDNVIIAPDYPELPGFNMFYKSRKEAGIGEYPMLPIPMH